MYFWNVKKIKSELSERSLSQAERFKYYLAGIILFMIATEFNYMFPVGYSSLLVLQSLATIVIAIAGILYCNSVNKRGDNAEFIDRMVCLGWVVGIRVCVVWILFYFLYAIVGTVFGGETFQAYLQQHNHVDVVFRVLVTGAAYFLIGRHLKDIAATNAEPS